jgi:hypothetical protein
MKKVSLLLFAVVALSITGCKKPGDNSGLSIIGSWDSSQVLLALESDNTYSITNGGIGVGLGTYKVSGQQITFRDTGAYCGFNQTGSYNFTLYTSTNYGTTSTSLLLTNANDSCTYRSGFLVTNFLKY